MGAERRLQERFRVNLAVRYSRARDFVEQYAENLSAGGLYIKGAQDLAPLEEVSVEIDLPALGVFVVEAQVVHVVSEERSTQINMTPGAGLAITRAPEGFDDALISYLQRLGRRAEKLVFCADDMVGVLLAAAGYCVELAPVPSELVSRIAACDRQIAAVVVPGAECAQYAQTLQSAGARDLLIPLDSPEQFDAILSQLDQAL